MNRRKLFGLLGLGSAGVLAGTGVVAARVPHWADMTDEERLAFRDCCEKAWDATNTMIVPDRQYKWRTTGFRWVAGPNETVSPIYFNEEVG